LSIVQFWTSLHEGGHVLVDPVGLSPQDQRLAAAIKEIETQWRLELAYVAPSLLVPVAIWGVEQAYRACQYLVFRETEPQVVQAGMQTPCPLPPSPSVCYSADLGLRLLPDLFRQAKAASPDDPLVTSIRQLAQQWPLSSVGIPDVGEVNISAFIDDACLRRLYADRIIERADAPRLADARAAEGVREALGNYPQQAPALAAALATRSH
jgi:hypothetical protein